MNKQKIEDIHISSLVPLITPIKLHQDLPMSKENEKFVLEARKQIKEIIDGKDKRLLVISGPCSIHDSKAAKEYADKLKSIQKKYEESLFIAMRVYFEKPRTTIGWKGLINDPDMNSSFDIKKGLHLSRELLLHLCNEKIPVATEFLDVFIPQYIADLISWGAIGARTTESQIHRQLASGLSMPIGFKNGTNGDIEVATQACFAAQKNHHFLSVNKEGQASIVGTIGNFHSHIILRGGKKPNYDSKSVGQATNLLKKQNLPPKVMIDCSHSNSGKDFKKQKEVAIDVAQQIENGSQEIFAVMLESHLIEGVQKISKNPFALTYGQSITDACMGWEDTALILEQLAKSSLKRIKS